MSKSETQISLKQFGLGLIAVYFILAILLTYDAIDDGSIKGALEPLTKIGVLFLFLFLIMWFSSTAIGQYIGDIFKGIGNVINDLFESIGYLILFVIAISIPFGILYIIAHFIIKYW